MSFPVFDLHCDTAFALLDSTMKKARQLRRNDLHIDLERASRYPAYAQCFACFTSPLLRQPPEQLFVQELDAIHGEVSRCSDQIAFAGSAEQIRENSLAGKMSAVMSIEGPAGFGYDPGYLKQLFAAGFRMTTLGWNESNILTGSHLTGEGLTAKGCAYLREAQNLGMLVDVSHISDEGFWDILALTQAPVVASHSNSRKVCDVSRNLTDDMFLAICKTGGVAGINLYADFLGDQPTLDTVCDHIFHFLELDPDGTHIALGGDLDGCDKLPEDFRGIEDYDKLADRLLSRGLNRENVTDIFWNNALGVIERCCM